MKEFLEQYGVIILGIFSVVLIVVIFPMAAKAYSKRQNELKATMKELERLKELKEKYQYLTAEKIENAPDEILLEAVALSLQFEIQNLAKEGKNCEVTEIPDEKLEEIFETFSEEKKLIYALDVFVQDKVSKEFFSQNGDILKSKIANALNLIGEDYASKIASHIARMYDDQEENISFDIGEIEAFDKYMSENETLSKIKLGAAKYIKNNPEKFCDIN